MSTSAIEQCLTLAETASETSLRGDAEKLARLEALDKTLFGAEAEAKQALAVEITEIRSRLARQSFASKANYPRIPLEVLAWRHKAYTYPENYFFSLLHAQAPKLALVSLHEPTITFSVDDKARFSTNPWLPEPVQKAYEPLVKSLARVTSIDGREVELSFTFKGMIPSSTRAKIEAAKDDFPGAHDRYDYSRQPTGIYLLVESTPAQWRIRHVGRAWPKLREVLADPLVVGYRDNALWLIDSFDPTPFETYIATEFSE